MEKENKQSKINIVFDDKLKNFISKILIIFDVKIKKLFDIYLIFEKMMKEKKGKKGMYEKVFFTNVFQPFMKIQKEIREYIIKNQYELTIKPRVKLTEKSASAMPNFFAIFCCLCVDMNNMISFKNIFEKIKQSDDKQYNYYDDLDEYIKINFNCICCCSQKVNSENVYFQYNIDLKRCFMIGCNCAKKNELIEISKVNNLQNKIKRLKEKKLKKNTSIADNFRKIQLLKEKKKIFDALKNYAKNVKYLCCKCCKIINRKEYDVCTNKTCDCKNKKLQRLYCKMCATKQFSKISY